MGLWQRLLGRAEMRAVNLTSDLARALGISSYATDRAVSPAHAEQLDAVCACIDAVCLLASMPVYVQRVTDTGVVDLPNHPVARVLRRPNATMTQVDLLAWVLRQVLLWGNALCIIDWDEGGRPAALHPTPWNRVSVQLLPSGKPVYEVFGLDGSRRRYTSDEVWHLRDSSDDGIVGVPRLARASQSVHNALELQTFATSMFANAATPSGALEFEGNVSEAQLTAVRTNLEQRHTGSRNARSVLLLTNGAKWKSLSVSPEDAEILQSRKHATEAIARLFGVPSPIINQHDRSTFSNSETLIRFFAQSTLSWWASKLQASLEIALFGSSSSDCRILIDLSAYMRGDYATRWEVGIAAVQAGVLEINELREQEGFNKKPVSQPEEKSNAVVA
jgi:HK97 family phage portal protein